MMIKTLAAIAFFGVLVLPLASMAADSGQTTIYASGQATVSGAPDTAVVSFAIASHASTAEQATSIGNSVYAHLNTGMRTIGIASADIKTTSYNLNHVPPPPPCPPLPMQAQTRASAEYPQIAPCVRDPQTYGYFVNRSVSVTTHHLDIVGKIIDTAVAAGVNNVQGVEYSIADTKSLYLRALAQAVAAARTQANVLASAAGLHIVGVQSINGPNEAPVRGMAVFRANVAADTYQVPTQMSPPSSLDVSAGVSVIYLAHP